MIYLAPSGRQSLQWVGGLRGQAPSPWRTAFKEPLLPCRAPPRVCSKSGDSSAASPGPSEETEGCCRLHTPAIPSPLVSLARVAGVWNLPITFTEMDGYRLQAVSPYWSWHRLQQQLPAKIRITTFVQLPLGTRQDFLCLIAHEGSAVARPFYRQQN